MELVTRAKLNIDGINIYGTVLNKKVRFTYYHQKPDIALDNKIRREAKRHNLKWYAQGFNLVNNVRDICFDLP